MKNIYKRLTILTNREKYLPFLYPLLMPIIALIASGVVIPSFQAAVKHCVWLSSLHIALIILFRKILYLSNYKQVTKWLIASVLGCVSVLLFLFLEFNVFNFALRYSDNKFHFILRSFWNIPLIMGLLSGIKSAAERKRLLIDNKRLEIENAQAQLHILIQKISPHFLFNSLAILQSMARSKDDRTETFVVTLADIYRQTLEGGEGMVTLQEELHFLNNYMYLMGLRQENALFVEVKIENASLNYHLPIFALQLLAENCIKHNIASISRPLTIRLYQKDPKSLTITNNLQAKSQKIESFGIGIDNLKKRYALEGFEEGVQIEKNETVYSTTIKLL